MMYFLAENMDLMIPTILILQFDDCSRISLKSMLQNYSSDVSSYIINLLFNIIGSKL